MKIKEQTTMPTMKRWENSSPFVIVPNDK